MTGSPALLPEITRPDAGVSTFSEWIVGAPQRQGAALDAAMDAWNDEPWPVGMLSYTCFVSLDGSTLRHHTQWTDDDARRRFWSAETPEQAPRHLAESRVARVRTIDEVVPGIERDGLAVYDLYRSYIPGLAPAAPGCIVIVTIDFDGPDRARQHQWIDAVLAALDAEHEPIPGLLGAHFHTSTDGAQVVNYAEWTSVQAHRDALDNGPAGLGQTDLPEWRRVVDFPGVEDLAKFNRYREHRSLAGPPTPAGAPAPHEVRSVPSHEGDLSDVAPIP